jgi:TldD protein
MIDPERQLGLLKKALSRGGEYADLFVENRRQTSLVLEDGRLEKILSGCEAGAGIRLIFRGRTFYAYSNDLSETALMQAAREVSRAATANSESGVTDLKVRKPLADLSIDLFPEEVPVERKIEVVRTADRAARDFDRRIRQVSSIYRDCSQKVNIATSEGFLSEDERIYTTAVVQVIAASGDTIQTGYESIGGLAGFELFDENDIAGVSLKAARRAIMMLGAGKAPGGRMPVVISSAAGGTMIHEAIGHGLEADLSQQGLSVFSGKKGMQVASRCVTVIDDSTLFRKRGSFRFDDEGTPAQRTLLVKEGILKSFLYDRLSAMKDGVTSTGNGRRESYQYRPIPRMTNTFIAPGETAPDLIVKSLDRGLFVAKMGGGQVNTVTGDFVFDVQEGYLIEKGKMGEPVRGATLTGNGPEVLKAIDMVGSDLGFSIGTCGKDSQGVPVSDAMPTVRIPEMVVGGACSPPEVCR